MIHNSSRCSNNNGHLSAKRTDLFFNILSSVHRKHFYPRQIFCVAAQLICCLDGQFSGRAKHDCLHALIFRVDHLNKRNTKCRCFSSSGLCLSNDVTSFKQCRNSRLLNWCHLLISDLCYGADNPLINFRILVSNCFHSNNLFCCLLTANPL